MERKDAQLRWVQLRKYVFRAEKSRKKVSRIDDIDPEYCISQITTRPSLKSFSLLRHKLRKSKDAWMAEFVDLGGMDALLCGIEHFSLRPGGRSLGRSAAVRVFTAHEGILCVKRILNSEVGLAHLQNSIQLVYQLARGKKFRFRNNSVVFIPGSNHI